VKSSSALLLACRRDSFDLSSGASVIEALSKPNFVACNFADPLLHCLTVFWFGLAFLIDLIVECGMGARGKEAVRAFGGRRERG